MCLQQVFWNLLFNVIKFILVEGCIDLQLWVDGNYWEIIVCDSGDGIVFEFFNYLFSCFCQVDGIIICCYGGLGLGFVIVQQLVELYGGMVIVVSEGYGYGVIFIVCLFQYVFDVEWWLLCEVISGLILELVIVELYLLCGMYVLVVEDQLEVLEYLWCMLEEQGVSVLVVSLVGEVLVLLVDIGYLQYYVLLIDIGMLGMDGYGLVCILCEDMGVDVVILFVVVVIVLVCVDDCCCVLVLGFQEYVVKLYLVVQLVVVVCKVQVLCVDSVLY